MREQVQSDMHGHEMHKGHGMPVHEGAQHDHHAMMVADFKKRFWVSLVITIPILILSPAIQAWATGYNVFAIPLAAGVLYQSGILLTPAMGAVLMSLSTIIVAINARFLRVVK